jgi:non-specific serine/threonine protein kinase/serine/threonine-protein kinase
MGLLRNELDWIVMKSLEKDRSRRYETANGFATDINRYLTGEAVLAHPPSTAYRVKKFIRRHKAQMIAASLVLFALLAGMAGTTIGLIEAKKQERLAVDTQIAEADRAEGERQAKLTALGIGVELISH